MRIVGLAVMAAMLGGCTVARMEGFDAMAAGGEADRVDVRGVPATLNGRFQMGEATGYVRRSDRAEAVGWGPDRIGSDYDNVRYGVGARFGTIAFSVERADLGGKLEGRCSYARTEVRENKVLLDVTSPAMPLSMQCLYRLNDRDIGGMDLRATDPHGGLAEPRLGEVHIDGVDLILHSAHRFQGVPIAMGEPVGYTLDTQAGTTIGAIEQSGQDSHLLLPRERGPRLAGAAAMLTLSLFRDPGNTG